MKQYQHILFDWDGSLAMTLDIWLEAYKEVFAEYDVYPQDKEITLNVFGDWNGPRKFGIEDIDGYTKKLLTEVNKKYVSAKLYEGAKETIKQLKKDNKKIALLTTSKHDLIFPSLKHHQLLEYFDVVLTAESVTKHKPDPEIVEKVIWGQPKMQTLIRYFFIQNIMSYFMI